MLYQTDGVVLFQNDLGENDKVVTIFTRDEGLVRAKVTGARKAESKLRGLTQPFTFALFQLWRGTTMDRVIQVAVRKTYKGLLSDYGKMVYANYLSELLAEISPERERNPGGLAFFLSALSCLEEREDPWPVVRWAELGLLSMAGFSPSFSSCAVCRTKPKGDVVFSFRDGTVICKECLAHSGKDAQDSSEKGETIDIAAGTRTTLEMLLSDAASYFRGCLESGGEDRGRSGTVGSENFRNRNVRACPKISARGKVRTQAGSLMRRYVTEIVEKRLKSMALVESIESEEG